MAKGIEIRLYDDTTAQASLTGLTCLWWDQTDVYDFGTPIGRTDSATTDSDGDLILDLDNVSGLSVGDYGYLLVRKEDGTDHRDSLVFQGRVQVSTVSGGTALTYTSSWKRNPDWQTLTTPTGEKFVGLHAVYEAGSNFLALSAQGAYTVDWGDGSSTEDIASDTVAYHTYDYTSFDSGKATQGAVTFTDSGDTVNKTAHGRNNGDTVVFESITTTTGLTVGQVYYVVNKTDNTYQVADTPGGTAKTLTNDGSGYTLKYKTVVVSVVPQSGQNLTQLNLHRKHNESGLQTYSSGFLDIAIIAPNMTDLRLGAETPGSTTQTIRFLDLERFNLIESDLRQCEYLFYTCFSLANIVDVATSSTAAASMSVTFTDSTDLVTSAGHGFRDGDSVIFTEITSTTGITVGARYFVLDKTTDTFKVAATYGGTAVALTTDGSGTAVRGTSFSTMFSGCYSLTSIPLLDTAAGTSFSSMFSSCLSFTSIPLLNTAAGTSFSSMFNGCYSLTSIPLLDTAAGTSFSSMFNNCYSLASIPLLDTAAGTSFSAMFNGCLSLTSIPLLDTAAGTSFSAMFSGGLSLTSIPLLDTAAGTSFSGMFSSCNSLAKGALSGTPQAISYASCKLSGTELDAIYTALPTVTGKTITVTGNWGTASDTPSIATAKGWTVTGS